MAHRDISGSPWVWDRLRGRYVLREPLELQKKRGPVPKVYLIYCPLRGQDILLSTCKTCPEYWYYDARHAYCRIWKEDAGLLFCYKVRRLRHKSACDCESCTTDCPEKEGLSDLD